MLFTYNDSTSLFILEKAGGQKCPPISVYKYIIKVYHYCRYLTVPYRTVVPFNHCLKHS